MLGVSGVPLAMDEILIRLLCSLVRARIAQPGKTDSHVQHIGTAMNWIRMHFGQPLSVELLAELVHMSPSAFHRQFKAVTNVNPVQFQTNVRWRFMLVEGLDVTTAGRQVGYVSSSQLIREYGRLFRVVPARDVAHLKEQGGLHGTLNRPCCSMADCELLLTPIRPHHAHLGHAREHRPWQNPSLLRPSSLVVN